MARRCETSFLMAAAPDVADAGGAAREPRSSTSLKPLFPSLGNASIHGHVSGPNWQIWRPSDAPIPARHPTGERCAMWTMRNSLTFSSVPDQQLCLQRHDRISDEMRRQGHWVDCWKAVRLWQRARELVAGERDELEVLK